METVEVVIRIPKEYKDYIEGGAGIIPDKIIQYLFNALDNGTVLPKGHGRLIDADAATKDINAFQDAFAMYTDNMGKYNIVCAATTVIDADNPESEVRNDGAAEHICLPGRVR